MTYGCRMRVMLAHADAGVTGRLHDCKCICSRFAEPSLDCIPPRAKSEIFWKTGVMRPFAALHCPQPTY